MNLKAKSILIETIGLTLLLGATVWQVFFSDALVGIVHNYQPFIQSEMEYQILWSISDIGQLIIEKNTDQSQERATKIHESNISVPFPKVPGSTD